MAKVKIKAGGKIVILGVIATLMFFDYKFGAPYILPQGKGQQDVSGLMAGPGSSSSSSSGSKGNGCINVGVVTWPGYAGGQYWNNGFKDNANSKFHQDGLCVNFSVMDDFAASRAAFKSGAMDLMWVTVDAFPTESGNYGENIKFLFQADWSRGGDAIVTKGHVGSVVDLQGKKIAVAEGTPSHTFLLWMIDMGGLSIMDVNIVKVPSAIDAAAAFKAGQVDAAVVWSPDDADCVKSVNGAKVLISTKQAANIIADGFMVKESYYNAHKADLKKLVEGWLRGAAEINGSDTAKQRAAQILSEGLQNVTKEFTFSSLGNVRLATLGDNKDFYGLNTAYTGVTGRSIYEKMTTVYGRLNLASKSLPWNVVADTSFISSLQVPGEVAAEAKPTFTAPTQRDVQAHAVASKPVKISFAHGSVALDENSQTIIDDKVVEQLKAFPTSRIRVEGNTDKTGSASANTQISRQRAQAVVDYLVQKHGFDINRFVVVGNGSSKPVCTEDTPVCLAKNRRTEFQILEM